jgi:hypothetical protein
MSDSEVPNVASNCSTENGRFGAKAALHFQSSNYRFVPKAVIYHQRRGCRVRLHLFVNNHLYRLSTYFAVGSCNKS